jgi:hypothetical protein
MKRVGALVATMAMLASIGASASAATPLGHDLLSPKVMPGLSPYYLAAAQTRSCPESTFRQPTSAASVREVLANRSSESLLLEKITTAKNTKSAYDVALANLTTCTNRSTADGRVTSARAHAVNLGRFSVPVRAFSVSFVLQGEHATGVIAYARKGSAVLTLADVSLTTRTLSVVKVLLAKALAKI